MAKQKRPAGSQSEYFRKWYRKNKKKVAEKRRRMWRENPEYREKIKKTLRDWVNKKYNILPDGSRIIVFEGNQYIAYKITAVATMVGVKKGTLSNWWKQGQIPNFMQNEDISTKIRMRPITVDQIPWLRKFANRASKVGVSNAKKELFQLLNSHWRDNKRSEKILSKLKANTNG